MIRVVFVLLVLGGVLGASAKEGQALGANYRGPFEGRVVDAETEEPIEGAVVFVEWMIHRVSELSTFFDAAEVLTDASGYFLVRENWSWNPWRTMGMDSLVYIYKAGYGLIRVHWGPISEAKALLNSLPEADREKPGSGCDRGISATLKMILRCPDREWDYVHLEGGQAVFLLRKVDAAKPHIPTERIPEDKRRLLMEELRKTNTD